MIDRPLIKLGLRTLSSHSAVRLMAPILEEVAIHHVLEDITTMATGTSMILMATARVGEITIAIVVIITNINVIPSLRITAAVK